jgi:hypothetical protein
LGPVWLAMLCSPLISISAPLCSALIVISSLCSLVASLRCAHSWLRSLLFTICSLHRYARARIYCSYSALRAALNTRCAPINCSSCCALLCYSVLLRSAHCTALRSAHCSFATLTMLLRYAHVATLHIAALLFIVLARSHCRAIIHYVHIALECSLAIYNSARASLRIFTTFIFARSLFAALIVRYLYALAPRCTVLELRSEV